jgi:hypothetical protein
MIIRELKLNPFAGLANQALQFNRGLNVVVGPNEAGKSTIVNALKMAMFMGTHYTTPPGQRQVGYTVPDRRRPGRDREFHQMMLVPLGPHRAGEDGDQAHSRPQFGEDVGLGVKGEHISSLQPDVRPWFDGSSLAGEGFQGITDGFGKTSFQERLTR